MNLTYTAGTDGEVIDLGTPSAFIDPSGGLRSRAWAYELSYRRVGSMSYPAREVELAWYGTYENADKLRQAADADNLMGADGKLTLDGWSQRARIVSQKPATYQHGRLASSIGVLLLDGFWWREQKRYFPAGLDSSGLNYDHNFEHNYGHSVGGSTVEIASKVGAMPRITFYGPITNPYVTIGGNRYQVDAQVLSGYSLVLDATQDVKTVMLYDPYGNGESMFDKAVRTGGAGGGSYAFEPLPHGTLEVSWSGSFAFELAWRERETEPTWTR